MNKNVTDTLCLIKSILVAMTPLNFIVSDEIHNMLGSNDSGSLGVCELTLRVDLLVCFDVVLEAS